MNKAELVDELSSRFDGDRKQAARALDGVVDVVSRAVAAGDRVAISGFGIFERVARPARAARNPRTGAAVDVPESSSPRFRPGQGFKTLVNGAGATSASALRTAKKTATSGAAGARKTAASAMVASGSARPSPLVSEPAPKKATSRLGATAGGRSATKDAKAKGTKAAGQSAKAAKTSKPAKESKPAKSSKPAKDAKSAKATKKKDAKKSRKS